MPTDEEIRYYQSLNEEQKRNYTRRLARGLPLSGEPLARDQFDTSLEHTGKKTASIESLRVHKQSSRDTPREQPRAASRAPAKQSFGSKLLGGAKNWLENAAANQQGREPPHKTKSAAGRWLANASMNINSGSFNPFGNISLPSGPPGMGFGPGPAPRAAAPRKRSGGSGATVHVHIHGGETTTKKKKKHQRREPEESKPWDPNHIPPGLRDVF
jgi:hypothetical protein